MSTAATPLITIPHRAFVKEKSGLSEATPPLATTGEPSAPKLPRIDVEQVVAGITGLRY